MTIRLQEVTVQSGVRRLCLNSPPHPRLAPRARAIGGQYVEAADAWYFDPAEVGAVRLICLDLYDRDPLAGSPPGDRLAQLKAQLAALPLADWVAIQDWMRREEEGV